MMTFSEALTAARRMVELHKEMINSVSFGPRPHDRYSGALISLSLRHLEVITALLSPEARMWPSGFALSRVAADAALRAVYLGFGDSAPNFPRRYKTFIENKPNPFGGPKDILEEIRAAFSSYPLFVAWQGENPRIDSDSVLRHLEADWGSLSGLTHSGEIQARLALHDIRTGEPPNERIRTVVLFATTRTVSECVGIVLAQRNEPERSSVVSTEFKNAFPPAEMVDD